MWEVGTYMYRETSLWWSWKVLHLFCFRGFPFIDRFWHTLQLALGTSTVRGGFTEMWSRTTSQCWTALWGFWTLEYQSPPQVERHYRLPLTSASSHYYTKGGGKKENYNLHFPGRNMPWRCLGACFGGSRHVILQTWFKSHFLCGGLTYYNQLTAKPTVGPWNFLSCKNIKHFEGAAKPGFWQVDGLVSAVYPLKPNLFNRPEVKNRKYM